MQLLLVEDDSILGGELHSVLQRAGYMVTWVTTAESAISYLQHTQVDILLIDIGLPGLNGLELLQLIRRNKHKTPAMFLTARDTVQDKVKGLDAGADDYLLKPFDLDELLARLRALLRRSKDAVHNIISCGPIEIDVDQNTCHHQGKEIPLSRREYKLLLVFVQNLGRVLSREYLEQSIYGWNEDVESNALEVHIHNIRKKIPINLIKTVRGLGYRADAPQE
jgi:DNA-binding response OmpR family regulator